MNKENAHLYLPLVQALADGKTIQQQSENGQWHDMPSITFASSFETYRIKQEPREWMLHLFPDGSGSAYTDEQVAKGNKGTIRVREIID